MSQYFEVVNNLEQRGIMPDRPPGLVQVQKALEELKIKYPAQRVIVIAGTNGKGTVSATLATLLQSTGARVGLYTSPHLVDTRERIRINMQPVSEAKFVEAHNHITENISHAHLSHFEMLTLVAHFIFSQENCDWLIYEVGLGGIWDATNAIDHDTSVICRLGLDHEDILGAGLWNIAKNKLGIVRDETKHKVFHLPFPEEILPEIAKFTHNCRANFTQVLPYKYEITTDSREPRYLIATPWGPTFISMLGARAVENTTLAIEVFKGLGFNPKSFLSALAKVIWPGRMDYKVVNQKKIYFSGDHNPQGVDSLAEILRNFKYDSLWAIVGIGKSKNFTEMLEKFLEIPRLKLVLTETPFRGLKVSEYGKYVNSAAIVEENPNTALERVLDAASENDLVLVSGSLYLVGQLYK